MRLRDNASAATFNTPGMCREEKWNEYMALKKDKHRSKCVRSDVLAVLLPRMATTAMLSQWKHTWLPDHCFPHMAAAITTGTSFLAEISIPSHSVGHCAWNHPTPAKNAPHPKLPEASE